MQLLFPNFPPSAPARPSLRWVPIQAQLGWDSMDLSEFRVKPYPTANSPQAIENNSQKLFAKFAD